MNNIEILEEFIKHYKEVQEKYKDDEIQAEIERSCYFEEVPAEAIEKLIQENKELKEKNNILQTNYEILQVEMDRIGIDTLGLEPGNSTDDVIEEIKNLKKKLESEIISHKNDSDSMSEINTILTQESEDCIKIIDKYRFCKVEKLKDFYKEIKEIFEGE